MVVMAIAGCATGSSGELSGRHGKNGGQASVERLGSITSAALPGELRCGSKQVMWCADGRSREACQCLYVREAQDRVRRMADQMNTSVFRKP